MKDKAKAKLIVDFIEIQRKMRQQSLRPNIKELLNQTFVVYDVSFGAGKKGEFAIVKTDYGEYITFSKVLIDQLRAIDEYMTENEIDGVFVKLIQRENYLTFTSPSNGGENERS